MSVPDTSNPPVPPGTSSAPANLSGRLGVGSIVFMVIAAAAPLTVIGGNVPLAVGNGNGVGAPVGFLIASAVLLLFAVGFVTMTPYVTVAGAFFAYVTMGLGKRAGTGAALTALLAYTAIQAGVYGYLGWATDDLVKHFGGPAVPWWVYALAVVGVVALLGYRHIELSSRVLGVALVLEIAIVVVMDLRIFFTGGAEGNSLTSFTPDAITSGPLGVAVLFALTGFIGFEATAIFRDEARDPERTIPRATYLAVLIIGLFYTISCWAIVTGVGPSNAVEVAGDTLAGNGNMMLDTAQTYLGTMLRDVMQVLLISSLFACVLSFHNVVARYQFVLARRGLMPAGLGTVHRRHHSPARSSVVQTITAAVLLVAFVALGLDPLVGVFGSMAGVSTVGMVLLMLLTSIAVLVWFARNPRQAGGRLWTTRIAPVLAVLGLLASAWLVVSNFTMVTGGSVGVSIALGLAPPAVFLVGCVIGQRGARAAFAAE
ncbi:APC family permease [Actinoplanes sp. NBC_00393]|uniref:APC family permease n=1 Tax=Actinoplanes sp. NBC_00393 TaxID=2975953 RepID=UPI002E23B7C5